MINSILFRLPLWMKILLGKSKTFINREKSAAIRAVDGLNDGCFRVINSKKYKNNLKNCLSASILNADETKDYIHGLYNDEVKLVNEGTFYQNRPVIIGVVKNEATKLKHFFEHYSKLGQFNYVFIDNGSTDGSIEMMISQGAKIYQCMERFSTFRKLGWINKVYSEIPCGLWTVQLDADELLTYCGYEETGFDEIIKGFDSKGIKAAGAVMVDMFSDTPVSAESYMDKYVYFENDFHEEKSFYFNSIYGGIREREFKTGSKRIFLIKKHPVVKKDEDTMLIHCHYLYPFKYNLKAETYFALIHYKLFDGEIEKYKKIAMDGSYGDGSVEYKRYIETFKDKTYEEIFKPGVNTVRYEGTASLEKISCLKDVRRN